jgi:hypothetical protein
MKHIVVGTTYHLKRHGTVEVIGDQGSDLRIPVKNQRGGEIRLPPRAFEGAAPDVKTTIPVNNRLRRK